VVLEHDAMNDHVRPIVPSSSDTVFVRPTFPLPSSIAIYRIFKFTDFLFIVLLFVNFLSGSAPYLN